MIRKVRFEFKLKNDRERVQHGNDDAPTEPVARRVTAAPTLRPVLAYERQIGGAWRQDALQDVPPALVAVLGGLAAGAGMPNVRWSATAQGDTLTINLGELDDEPFAATGIGPEGAPLKPVEVRGLARCAAMLEASALDGAPPITDGHGQVWDSECLAAVAAARRAGLIGPRPQRTTSPLEASCGVIPTGKMLLAVSASRDGGPITLAFDGGTSIEIRSDGNRLVVSRRRAGSPYPLPTRHAPLDDHLVNAIANDRAAYHLEPADAIRHARSLAQEVRCARDNEVYSARVARTRDILLPWGGGDQLMKLPDLAERVVARLQRTEASLAEVEARLAEVTRWSTDALRDSEVKSPADRATRALVSIAVKLGVTISTETSIPWIENARTVIVNAIDRLIATSGDLALARIGSAFENICRRLGCALPTKAPESILAASDAAMRAIDHLTKERNDANSNWAAQIEQTHLICARTWTALDDISVALGMTAKLGGDVVGSEKWTAAATAAITRAAGKLVTGMRDAAEMEQTWHQRCREAEDVIAELVTGLGIKRSDLKSPWVDSAHAAIRRVIASLLASPAEIPPRKVWGAENAADDETADYVDGWNDALDALNDAKSRFAERRIGPLGPEPIPMRLVCPGTLPNGDPCARLHIDRGEWTTRHHHTHACQFCGHVWRPALVPTVGVQFLPGFKDEITDSETRSA